MTRIWALLTESTFGYLAAYCLLHLYTGGDRYNGKLTLFRYGSYDGGHMHYNLMRYDSDAFIIVFAINIGAVDVKDSN